MGTTYAEITLKNAGDVENVERGFIKESEIRQMTVRSVVDTGAYTLFINEALRQRLGLQIQSSTEVVLADERIELCPTTEAVAIYWKDRVTACSALVFPGDGEVLFGAIPMEAMDLIVDPRNERLVGKHGDKALLMAK
jgi:clan AA aspartic protease